MSKEIDFEYGDMVDDYFSIKEPKNLMDNAYECIVSNAVRTRRSINGVCNGYKCQVLIKNGKIVSSNCECKWSTIKKKRCKHCCAICLYFT